MTEDLYNNYVEIKKYFENLRTAQEYNSRDILIAKIQYFKDWMIIGRDEINKTEEMDFNETESPKDMLLTIIDELIEDYIKLFEDFIS